MARLPSFHALLNVSASNPSARRSDRGPGDVFAQPLELASIAPVDTLLGVQIDSANRGSGCILVRDRWWLRPGATITGPLCATDMGFTVHAATISQTAPTWGWAGRARSAPMPRVGRRQARASA
jgi:hypothetical protein